MGNRYAVLYVNQSTTHLLLNQISYLKWRLQENYDPVMSTTLACTFSKNVFPNNGHNICKTSTTKCIGKQISYKSNMDPLQMESQIEQFIYHGT